MADYHPLITRAVEGLGNNTADARRTLYERARAALVAQLRGIDPPLSEAEITRERLALEDAIRKVEAERCAKPGPSPDLRSRRVRSIPEAANPALALRLRRRPQWRDASARAERPASRRRRCAPSQNSPTWREENCPRRAAA